MSILYLSSHLAQCLAKQEAADFSLSPGKGMPSMGIFSFHEPLLSPLDPGTSYSVSRVADTTVSHLYVAQTGLSVVLYKENMSKVV